MVKVLRYLLIGTIKETFERVVYQTYPGHGYVAMLIGCGLTILVQSSSITTSVLTPLVGLGGIDLHHMYPLTLGANIGTTVTSVMAALVSDKPEGMQIAMCHLFFNIFGILIWYPIPMMRRVPLRMATALGQITADFRWFPIAYIVTVFFLIPFALFGLCQMFEEENGQPGLTIGGSIIVAIIGLAIIFFVVWLKLLNGDKVIAQYAEQLRKKQNKLIAKLSSELSKTEQNQFEEDFTGRGEGEFFHHASSVSLGIQPDAVNVVVQDAAAAPESDKHAAAAGDVAAAGIGGGERPSMATTHDAQRDSDRFMAVPTNE
mmetsp:Transcript_32091/g.79527  ORF Transcript_32091/g.79527 Transcript_32091/m.79527 type:complete len:317 (-) Transcript_32091:489-1439(-)